MDLLCTETVISSSSDSPPQARYRDHRGSISRERPVRRALPDPTLLQDRVLKNLLQAEEHHGPISPYFGTQQTEITPHMRTIVVEWMLEVCEEQTCQEEVFPLAVNYMDRFLSMCYVARNHLQLLGSTCLLIASKLREPISKGLPAAMLVHYTDNSITISDLCQWELLVLSKLKWDMAVVTPNDFLALLVTRLPLNRIVEAETVIGHAQTFIALAAKDFKFTMYSASTMAAASIAAALQGLEWGTRAGVSLEELLQRLHTITGVEQDYLQTCLEQIEQRVQSEIDERKNCNPNGWTETGDSHGTSWNQGHNTQEKVLDKAGTPTDVRDVHF